MRIAVVAPSCPLDEAAVEPATARAAAVGAELVVHPQCFSRSGHFAGPDEARLDAYLEVLGDPDIHAVWHARGGYGSNRIAEAVRDRLPEGAAGKTVLGYSDAGFMLSALDGTGVEVAHGPMVQDVLREGGAAAIDRSLAWLARRDPAALEPGLREDRPVRAFNLEVLVSMLGTPIAPRLEGVELLIEEVGEHLYAIDRAMFMLTGQAERPASLRLGSVTAVPENEFDFGEEAEALVRKWCDRTGIDYRGRAAIGHDAHNHVVPFAPR